MTRAIDTSLSDLSGLAGQVDRMARAQAARRERPVLREARITLSHGSGGKASRNLIDGLIAPILGLDDADTEADSVVLAAGGAGRIAFTTDSYVVSPLFFPGGDIGALAVHGTINDLATAGAQPLALSLGFILEEGLEVDVLRRILESIASAAGAAGVRIRTGDTKVVPRGKADLLFINTSGVGLVPALVSLSASHVRPGDRILLSGSAGEHGIAVMLAREALEIEADIRTDSAALHRMAAAVLDAAPGTRCLKDPTRGGVATSLNEIARASGTGIAIDETEVRVRQEVRGACEILGLDPLHIANEGKLLAVVPPDEAEAALAAMRQDPLGGEAAIIGDVLEGPSAMVVVRTEAGGSRVLDMLVGDPLPRIC
jgi:hydrogenase expression/formation protein HypE